MADLDALYADLQERLVIELLMPETVTPNLTANQAGQVAEHFIGMVRRVFELAEASAGERGEDADG